MLRGFANYPDLPQFPETWGLRAAALAVYPMYRGLAKLAGVMAMACPGGMAAQMHLRRQNWDNYDYFFVH